MERSDGSCSGYGGLRTLTYGHRDVHQASGSRGECLLCSSWCSAWWTGPVNGPGDVGQAQSMAQGMLDKKRLDPTTLWSALESYYDTALNCANVVLFDIRRLINIRLDPDITAAKFISEYRECLQRLRKNNARLADDNDTLRALHLVAIQDDDFEMVRDSIVHKPDSTVNHILTELCERKTSLMMKDQSRRIVTERSA